MSIVRPLGDTRDQLAGAAQAVGQAATSLAAQAGEIVTSLRGVATLLVGVAGVALVALVVLLLR